MKLGQILVIQLVFSIFSAMIGILHSHFLIWLSFYVGYIALCMYLSFKIYFLGFVLHGFKKVEKEIHQTGLTKKTFTPNKKGKDQLLVQRKILKLFCSSSIRVVDFGQRGQHGDSSFGAVSVFGGCHRFWQFSLAYTDGKCYITHNFLHLHEGNLLDLPQISFSKCFSVNSWRKIVLRSCSLWSIEPSGLDIERSILFR